MAGRSDHWAARNLAGDWSPKKEGEGRGDVFELGADCEPWAQGSPRQTDNVLSEILKTFQQRRSKSILFFAFKEAHSYRAIRIRSVSGRRQLSPCDSYMLTRSSGDLGLKATS